MTFFGIDNQTVELEITGYEFPEISVAEFESDDNWLNISLNVKSNFGNWSTVYPSLTTSDVEKLINWFDTLSKNVQSGRTCLSFIEPNLLFELFNEFNSDKKMIRINFDLEFRPPYVTLIDLDFDKEYFVDICADNLELKKIAIELKKELDKYPDRKPLGV
ncbi:hypothetical protein [Emticicia sp.]|uniref:WapI family immunity protein n=1 Tax=Emticicia sp. TaxID=1930953 RepID=UPI003753A59D